jgi:cell division protein FtsQ
VAGMVVLITAAMKEQQGNLCKGYNIKINSAAEGKQFTSEQQILKLLKAATKGEIKGQVIKNFNLPQIEDLLEQSAWVYNAELYFDNLNILHVNVSERKPLARVFTDNGQSFYLDESGRHIPLSDNISIDVPVFTGYPSKKVFNATDSLLVENVIATSSFISNDSFWSSQVSQININSCGINCRNMEMVPVVGNHIINLGDGSDIASKFHRIFLFYNQVLKKVGFDKYQKLDVQYDGQVVGIKEKQTLIDSIQLRKNIESLLQQSRSANDLMEVAPALAPLKTIATDTSAEEKEMYREVIDKDLDSLSMEPAVINKNTSAKKETKKEAKSEIKTTVEPKTAVASKPVSNASIKTNAKPSIKPESKTSVKPEPKKEIKREEKTATKSENKSTETKKKPIVVKKEEKKQPASKPQAKKEEVKKTDIKKPVSKENEKNNTSKTGKEAAKKTELKKEIKIENNNNNSRSASNEVKTKKKESVQKPKAAMKKLNN